jgi:hypothetical protein
VHSSKHSIYLPVKSKSVSVSCARRSSTSALLSLSSCTSDPIAGISFFERSMLVIFVFVLLKPEEENGVLDHDASESVYICMFLRACFACPAFCSEYG